MKARKLPWILVAPLLFVAPACDDGDDGDGNTEGDGDGDTTSDGTTPCGTFGAQEIFCQAGQYCQDPVLTLCENGCLTNANCAADQTCVKAANEDVGTCQNNAPDGPNEQEFCDKLLVCDPSATMEQCSTVYAGTNEACHQCIVDNNCGDINNNGVCDVACGI